MKTKNKNKYRNIKDSLSNDIVNVWSSLNTIEQILNDKDIDIKNDSINECKNSILNIFYKLDEYTRQDKLTY